MSASKKISFIFALCMMPIGIHAETMTQDQYMQQVDRCYDIPNDDEHYQCKFDLLKRYTCSNPNNQSQDDYTKCVDDLKKRLGYTESSKVTRTSIKATLVYRCKIPPFVNSELGASLTIWSTPDNHRYFAIPDRDQTSVFSVTGFGSPGNGDMKFTFSDGATATITPSGWTVTSMDKIHNKNSLYGQVSSEPILPPSECKLATDKNKVTKSFSIESQK